MKRNQKLSLCVAVAFLVSFVLWTIAVCNVDVMPIGPKGTSVGLANLNSFVHNLTGVHFSLYILTDWLGLVPVAFAVGFAILGLVQWVARKKLKYVDRNLFVLGGFYLVTIAAYIFFEYVVINYRPVLIEGSLEASYPSSTTLLVLCVMPTALLQLKDRIQYKVLRSIVCVIITAFVAFMVVGRLLSGVHWLSDIVGGTLLSTGLVALYRSLTL